MRLCLTISLVVLAGCPKDPNDPARAAQRCNDAAAMAVMALHDAPTGDTDTKGNFRAVIANRCVEDRWTAEAIECTASSAASEALKTCWYKHLSQEQQEKVTRAATAFMAQPEKRALGVTAIEPAKGDPAGGTTITLKGARFTADGPRKVRVFVGEREAPSVRFKSDEELIVQTPPGKVGEVVDVRLQFDPGGEIVMPKAFTYEKPEKPEKP
jgi:hypothetical protein